MVKHPTTYPRMMSDRSNIIMGQVCKIIAAEKSHILSVGFTSDLWTSRAGDQFISLTMSWISPKWRMLRFTPFVHPFHGHHTGLRISLELDDMLEELGFESTTDKVCVTDNAANMKVAIAESYHLREYFCNIHSLQLAINDTFKNVDGMADALAKGRKIAKFCHQSVIAMDQLRKSALGLDVPFKTPKNPVATRWDSQYECMESILYLKDVLQDVESSHTEWEEKSLTKVEWKLFEGAAKVLSEFRKTTKLWQYESIPTINLVIDRVYCMEDYLTNFIANRTNEKYGITFAKELKKNLEKRFPNHGLNVDERRAANYLDPRLKGIYLKKFRVFESTKDELESSTYRAQYEEVSNLDTVGRDSLNNNEPRNTTELTPTEKLRLEIEAVESLGREVSPIKLEMMDYERLPLASEDQGVLGWWRDNEKTLPILSKIARKIMAIPASSGKSERVFSTGGNFVTSKRTRLNAKKVESLIVIKENKQQIETYLRNLGGPLTHEENNFDSQVFQKVKLVNKVVSLDSSSDVESSGDEYFIGSDSDEDVILE